MRTVEYYLDKGFALPYAEYFASGRKSIVKATANDDFSVTLEFDNGERRRLGYRPPYRQRKCLDQQGRYKPGILLC